jgi:DNA-binding transcriptional ArsR family regulator
MNVYLNHALQALSDPTRLAILQNLAERPRAVSDLARGFPVSRPAISQHLKVLKTAGLVTDHADGTQRVYQIDEKGIAALKLHFDQLWSSVLAGFKQSAEASAANSKPGAAQRALVSSVPAMPARKARSKHPSRKTNAVKRGS